MILEDKVQIVLQYLNSEFEGYEIELFANEDDSRGFRISKESELYLLIVTSDFFEVNDMQSIPAAMNDYQVSNVLRSIGGLKVLLSSSGCIFEG